MDRNEAFELLKFLEDNQYLAGSLTAEQLIEVIADENEFAQAYYKIADYGKEITKAIAKLDREETNHETD